MKTARTHPCVLCQHPRARLCLLTYTVLGATPRNFMTPRAWFCARCYKAVRDEICVVDFRRKPPDWAAIVIVAAATFTVAMVMLTMMR
jgi:hypothetical protein